jgi:hypothetical protein
MALVSMHSGLKLQTQMLNTSFVSCNKQCKTLEFSRNIPTTTSRLETLGSKSPVDINCRKVSCHVAVSILATGC